jgi:regulator of protease activity HflC (stomatin/prohibitin superfamily)
MRAINSKVEQEQLRLAAENRLLTVEAEQKQKVAIAEAEANAVKAKADGDAYATVKNATANAEALRVQATAITSNPQILELKRIEVEMAKAQNWKGELPSAVYAGAPIPFFNIAGGQ